MLDGFLIVFGEQWNSLTQRNEMYWALAPRTVLALFRMWNKVHTNVNSDITIRHFGVEEKKCPSRGPHLDPLHLELAFLVIILLSLWQWCHRCLVYPHRTHTHTHTHINTPSSLSRSTGQLSLLLLSADGVGERGRGGGLEGLGVGGSTAEQMQKPLLGFAGAGLFPSHPAAVQLPRHQLSWWSLTKRTGGLPHSGGWLRKERRRRRRRWCRVVALYGPADALATARPPVTAAPDRGGHTVSTLWPLTRWMPRNIKTHRNYTPCLR